MDQVIAFAQERWIVIALAIAVILIIIKVVKNIVKWLIILFVAAGLIVYGYNYAGDIRGIGARIADYTMDEAVGALLGSGADAVYKREPDGTFTVTSGRFELSGREGEREARLSFGGKSIAIKLDDALAAFVETARSKSEQ